MGTYSGKHQVVLVGYIRAALMFFIVLMLGVIIAVLAHGYSLVDGLYWTIGCMTTAGDTLDADSTFMTVLYIIYLPTAAVAMLNVATTVIQTSIRDDIRHDNYHLKVHSLLQDEACAKLDPDATMREADFIIAVLRSRELIDVETIDAIRAQFRGIVRRDTKRQGADRLIDAEVVFKHLKQQRRVLPAEAHAGIKPAPTSSDERRGAVRYVNMHTSDGGYNEWYAKYWAPSVVSHMGTEAEREGAHPPDVLRQPPPHESAPEDEPPPLLQSRAYQILVDDENFRA